MPKKPKPKPMMCPDCDGRGVWVFATETGVCETCDGTGKVKL